MSKEIEKILKEHEGIEVNIEGYLQYYAIEAQLNILLGKILTIVDAIHQEKQQNKAIKDLVKSKFYEQLSHVRNIVYGDSNISSKTDNS